VLTFFGNFHIVSFTLGYNVE